MVDRDILHALDCQGLVITPFDRERLGPNSYDVTLAAELRTYKLTDAEGYRRALDCRVANETVRVVIPESGIVLLPGMLYLGSTVEYTESANHAPKLNGKSSLGRLGLFVHATAGEGDVGFCGTWTLEMTVVHPLIVYAGMPVAQLLWSTITSTPNRRYGDRASSKYSGQQGPTASEMYRNFSK
jgi:dCTP deaminase